MKSFKAGALALCLATAPSLAGATAGSLVIAGGGLRVDNSAVHEAFIQRLLPRGAVLIIPAASGQPAQSAAAMSETLTTYGVPKERLQVYPIALRDDPGTVDIDESQWQRNAWDEDRVARFSDVAGVWFTGGDQMRIVQLLRDASGAESPLLQLLRQRLAAGAVIGGTSAGAAIMSDAMITGGDSFRALTQPLAEQYEAIEEQDSGRLSLGRGLDFFSGGLVDQHFDRKARLGRLVRALQATDTVRGYGVDENTALVVDLAQDTAQVVGSGGVTFLDATSARYSEQGGCIASGLSLGYAHHGTTLSLLDQRLTGGVGSPTTGQPYYRYQPMAGGGMALANPGLGQALGFDLLDNQSTATLDRVSTDGNGLSLIYRFEQTESSRGYWHRATQSYAAEAVMFSICYE